MQNFAYTYDLLGNPLSRSDANTSMSETFAYDALNRLTSATVNLSPTPLSKSFTYSPIGNILSKSDVGTYNYNAPGSAQPHAVMSTSGGTISTTFTYDPNGNQTAGLGRTITWTSYNKPASITQGTRTINFLDDTEHQRFKQVTPEGTEHKLGLCCPELRNLTEKNLENVSTEIRRRVRAREQHWVVDNRDILGLSCLLWLLAGR